MYRQGDNVAGWVVDEVLGEGLYSAVYKVHREVLPEKIAVLKVLLRDGGLHDVEGRFLEEATRYNRVSHPVIPPLRDAVIDGGLWFMVTDLIEGQRLDHVLARRGPIPPQKVVVYVSQIASALMEAAEHDLHHRDIKAANVILLEDGSIRLVDFGSVVAKNAGQLINAGRLTADDVIYTPPEWLSRRPDPTKWDMYSLGILTYTMLTGSPPELPSGPGSDQQRLLQEAAHKGMVPFFDPGSPHPDSLRELVRWLTRAEPDERPEDLREVLWTVDDFFDATEVATQVVQRPEEAATVPELAPSIDIEQDDEYFDDFDEPTRRVPVSKPNILQEDEEEDQRDSWTATVVIGAAVGGAFGASALTALIMIIMVIPRVTGGSTTVADPAPIAVAAPAPAAAPAPTTAAAAPAPAPVPEPPPAPAGPQIVGDELPSDYDARKDKKKAFLAIDPPDGVKVDVYFLRDGEADAKLPWKAPFSNKDRGMRPFFPELVRGIKVVNKKAGIEETWDPHDLRAGEGQRWILKAPAE